MESPKCKIFLRPLSPQHQIHSRALSAFFLDIEKDSFLDLFNRQSSSKIGKNTEQVCVQKDSQQMFTDLYQRIQVRKHLNAYPKLPNYCYGLSEKIYYNKLSHQSAKSLNNSFNDLDLQQSSLSNIDQLCQIQQKNSSQLKQNKIKQSKKMKKGHLWNGIKVLQAQIENNKLRSLSESNSNEFFSQDQILCNPKKPKLKLQIKSVRFQKKIESNKLKLLSCSSQNKSNFYLNQSTEDLQNSQTDLLNQKKNNLAFNVFYENEDFMSSKYNQFHTLKRQTIFKQQEKLQNSSPTKQNQPSNNLSTPAKRSRATTQESSTQNTSTNINQNTNPISFKNEQKNLNQISVFQTNPEIISVTPLKNSSKTLIDNPLNCESVDSLFNKSSTPFYEYNTSPQDSYNQIQKQEENQHKKKIILKVKKDFHKLSPIMDPQIQNNKNLKEELNMLSFSSSPVKKQNFQIQKLNPNKKIVLYSKKSSTLNLKTSETEQNNNQTESLNFISNDMLVSTTKYLECRKKFTFSKALMSRDPQKFENDSILAQQNNQNNQ